MSSIEKPEALAQLIGRLENLRPDTPRRWGKMSAGEMLCHLSDVSASVLGRAGSPPGKPPRRLLKWIALYSPFPWPKGKVKTPRRTDPQIEGTRPGDFEPDRQRAVEGLKALASTPAAGLPGDHFLFGAMSPSDWRRWAWRHTDHHLRQFGL
jgi:Protein of unknown function (DUF1569)